MAAAEKLYMFQVKQFSLQILQISFPGGGKQNETRGGGAIVSSSRKARVNDIAMCENCRECPESAGHEKGRWDD